MRPPVRVSAVSFVNARPLVHGLESREDLFHLRFDVPSACAERLHAGEVDLGLIPAIEYVRGNYCLVPDMAIGSDGPTLSVAIFAKGRISEVRTLACDTSSRTSVALARILCAKHWRIAPRFVPAGPALDQMLAGADAALMIGDPALDIDVVAAGVNKFDLGDAWRRLTGLPFVYAAWAGTPEALGDKHLEALQLARDEGLAARDAIAREYAGADAGRSEMVAAYLRDNLSYAFGARERAGLERFFELAVEVGHIPRAAPLQFYACP